MLLEHRFTVPVPPDEAWVGLLDLERVAPCMPGATLESVDGEAFAGKVKVKVGPITVTYQGTGRFTVRDQSTYRVVIEASGREARGSGTATATVTALLEPRGDGETEVLVTTDLAITGRPAQFGRGVMSEVGAKLIGIFAECLAGKITDGEQAPGTAADPDGSVAAHPLGDQGISAPSALPRATAQPSMRPAYEEAEAAPIDLLDVAGSSIAKRVLPPVAGLAALAIALSWWLRRRRRP